MPAHPEHPAVPGVDVEPVSAWLLEHAPASRFPFRFDQIEGGHSNLTYRAGDAAGHRYVLRRPPLGHVLASAHDMGREHRIIAGLAGSAVPVPPLVGFCDDPEVNDQPFYVMHFVDGHVVRDEAEAMRVLGIEERATASRSIADTLAAIHAVDLDAAGLSDLGRHEGYIARQLKRWHGQWHLGKTRELPLVDAVHAALAAAIPEQGAATVVHGDYRLDNCIVRDDGTIAAVLDWEICTLGDPLADLGLLQVYWSGPDDDRSSWDEAPTTAPGFWNRGELVTRYAEVTGRDVSGLDYYIAFAYWKLACILEGVYSRYLGGALGVPDPEQLTRFKRQVEDSVHAAATLVDVAR